MWESDCEESWAPKHWCFWTVVLEKTLESPLDCKEIQPVHPEGDKPGCSLEGLMLKLKLQYFGHLKRRDDSLEKTLMLGGIGGRRRRGQQRMRWLDDITDTMGMSLSRLREFVMDREAWCAAIHGISKSRTWLRDWTEWTMYLPYTLSFFKSVPAKTQNWLDKPVCFTHANVLLSYVKETMSLLGNLSFFKIHVDHLWPGQITLCQCYLKACCGWGAWCQSLSFETFPFSNQQPASSCISSGYRLAARSTHSAPFLCLCQKLSLSFVL